MAKIQTSLLKTGRKESVIEYEFQDPENNPDVKLIVTFKQLGAIDQLDLPNTTADIVVEYITGTEEEITNEATGKTTKSFNPPTAIPPIGDEPVELTEGTANVIAILMASQVTLDPRDRYTVAEWMHILYCDVYAKKILKVLNDHILKGIKPAWLEGDATDPLASPHKDEQDSPTTSAKPLAGTLSS